MTLTVRQLKEFICDLPEIDDVTGDEFEVWIGDNNSFYSNEAVTINHLNRGDILIKTNIK